ncbi:MAG: ACP synthase [Actinobacteria bacterium HGW-Actinobacteria-10]|nr:MAG: ACP synthase [Actinobacteria bacterium HGW-Actinobacteria-10]
MIRGLGVDIVEIDRMREALSRHPRMRERVFSDAERAYCDARNKPEIHYAMRFAAKEAVLKALGTGFRGMRFRDVEVMRDEHGRPMPHLYGRAAEVAAERGVVELHLSLSFTHTTAVASAVAITDAHRPKPKDVPADPMAALAASFKEARAMLDDVDAPPCEGEEDDAGHEPATTGHQPESTCTHAESSADELAGYRRRIGKPEPGRA